MKDAELEELADAWIKDIRASEGSGHKAASSQAIKRLDDLEQESPDILWRAILTILSHVQVQDEMILAILAAGPLENFLTKYGEQFIDRVEIQARMDSKLAFLLGGVWQGGISDEIWIRIQKVWGRNGRDGIPK